MTKNPYLNALAAGLYIAAIVLTMNAASSLAIGKGTVLIPMAILGLFVLSAAVMGLLFLYQPFRLYAEGHMQEALGFFAKTLGTFAAMVVVFLAVLFFSMFR